MSLRFTFTSLRNFAVALIVLAAGTAAHAQSTIEKLVSPGELSRAHQDPEINCGSCHASFKKNSQNSLCRDCHKEVSGDIEAKAGFHGKSPEVSAALCKSCHTEHEGAGFMIARFDQKTFKHELTDYPLLGAHKKAACESCHLPGKKFRAAPASCNECHAKDDAHKGTLGKDCKSCHAETSWKDVTFDHAKTRFPLFGGHREAECASCHADQKFKGVPTNCVACHKKDDVHKGSFGADCADCHSENDWKKPLFDHAGKTGFTLRGGHRAIACNACHTVSLTEPKLDRACYACHRKDDVHKGLNGRECADCHSEENWKSSFFNHDTKTKFPLRGAHKRVDCGLCHMQPVTVVLPGKACIDCHRDDDPHQGALGERCGACHNETSWTESIRFDHDLAAFPLLGAHKNAACETCHKTKDYQATPSDCVSCHAEDDVHKETLGPDCAQCHNPVGWNHWRFDHDVQTAFVLDGAHKDLRCASCHRRPAREKVKQSSDCIACHRRDDKHRGRFGTNCARCHGVDSFDRIKLP